MQRCATFGFKHCSDGDTHSAMVKQLSEDLFYVQGLHAVISNPNWFGAGKCQEAQKLHKLPENSSFRLLLLQINTSGDITLCDTESALLHCPTPLVP